MHSGSLRAKPPRRWYDFNNKEAPSYILPLASKILDQPLNLCVNNKHEEK